MSYPYTCTKFSYERGAKKRHALVVTSSGTENLVIKRWTTGGSWGRISVQMHPNADAAMADIDAFVVIAEKQNYIDFGKVEQVEIRDQSALKKFIGVYWYKMGKEAVLMLDPEASIKGVQEPPEWQVDANGEWVAAPRAPKIIEEPLPPPKSVSDHVQENSDWGLF